MPEPKRPKNSGSYSHVWEIPAGKLPNRAADIWEEARHCESEEYSSPESNNIEQIKREQRKSAAQSSSSLGR